jgi:uncharacterized membrane protein
MALVGLVLLVLLVVLSPPVIITGLLFARTRRLGSEIEGLRARVSELEKHKEVPADAGSSRFQAGDVPPEPAVVPAEAVRVPPEGGGYTSSGRARLQAGGSPAQAVHVPAEAGGYASVGSSPLQAGGSPADQPESLESRIGGRWLLNIGIVAIVIGVAYFEKWAIDNHLIGETARIVQGALSGVALIYAGARFARRGLAGYGQMLAGGGVAILYVSTYAAFNYYHLIERPAAFAAMIAITVLGAALADHHRSQGLAVLAVGGGFATPFLLPGNTDAQVALFTYIGILIAGTVFLARRRNWPLLHIVSYVFTLLTVAAWADRFYAPAKYLRTEIYLTVYCAMFVAIARSCRRVAHGFGEFAAWFVWTAPLAYYAASLAILGDHAMAFLVWLISVAVLGGLLSVSAGTATGFALWSAAAWPLLAWAGPHAGGPWMISGLVTVAALYVIALAAQLRAAGADRPLRPLDIAWMHLNALLMFAGAYFLLETTHVAATGPLGAAFAAWHGALAGVYWRGDRDRAVHFAALAFTLLSIAIALQFDGPAVTVGWAAEGAVVVALGLFERRDWLRIGGALLLGIAIVRTIDLLLSTAPASHVVVLNPRAASALLVVALCYGVAWLHRRVREAASRGLAIGAGVVAAQIVTLVLLTSEIHAFWAMREGAFTRELMVSVTWAVYATLLIVVGLQRRYPLVRYFAIALFAITIAKVFFSDLAELQRIYRVMSLIGLGITLLLTSYLYQRMRRTPPEQDVRSADAG